MIPTNAAFSASSCVKRAMSPHWSTSRIPLWEDWKMADKTAKWFEVEKLYVISSLHSLQLGCNSLYWIIAFTPYSASVGKEGRNGQAYQEKGWIHMLFLELGYPPDLFSKLKNHLAMSEVFCSLKEFRRVMQTEGRWLSHYFPVACHFQLKL